MRRSVIAPAAPADYIPDFTGDYGDRIDYAGREFVFCYFPAARAKGDIVRVGIAGQASKNPAASTVATTAVPTEFGVACAALGAAGDGWVQVAGRCAFAKVDGTTAVAAGDALQAVNAAVHLVKDGGSTLTADTIAIAEAAKADAGAALTAVYLLGRGATIG